MSANPLKRINTYYILLSIALVVIVVVLIVTLRGTLSAWTLSREVDEETVNAGTRLNVIKLEDAYERVVGGE